MYKIYRTYTFTQLQHIQDPQAYTQSAKEFHSLVSPTGFCRVCEMDSVSATLLAPFYFISWVVLDSFSHAFVKKWSTYKDDQNRKDPVADFMAASSLEFALGRNCQPPLIQF